MEWNDILRSGLKESIHSIAYTQEGYEGLNADDINTIIDNLLNDGDFTREAEEVIYSAINNYVDNKACVASHLPITMYILQFKDDDEVHKPEIFISYESAYETMKAEYKHELKSNIDNDIETDRKELTDFKASIDIESNETYLKWEIHEAKVNS